MNQEIAVEGSCCSLHLNSRRRYVLCVLESEACSYPCRNLEKLEDSLKEALDELNSAHPNAMVALVPFPFFINADDGPVEPVRPINLNQVGITDHEDELEEEEIDLNDIVHDDLIAIYLIRVLNSPLIDDPLWISNESNKNTEAPAFMKFDISYDEITQLCEKASASFLAQPALVKIEKFRFSMLRQLSFYITVGLAVTGPQ
ncbi:hypothetical protein OSTOST_18392 [Ostertagia ostertagi]